MKKFYTTAFVLLIAVNVFAQNNIQLFPADGNVCNPTQVTLQVSGNSFQPVSYLWSTGETSPEIEIVTSGTYTLTVTGYQGNSNNQTTLTSSATYHVLPAPQIFELTDLWVCKGDTVKLGAVPGYDLISWSNGATGQLFEKQMNAPGIPGTIGLDTLSVYYTASLDGICSTTSQTVLLRSIRRPHGVGQFYQNRMNIPANDSIPAGLVTEYLYPVTYEMVFTDLANPLNPIKYITAPGSRRAPASMLTPGSAYTVVTTPVINGKKYCPGLASNIGIAPTSSNRIGFFTEEPGTQTFRVYDISGRLLMEKQAEKFNNEWLRDLPSQIVNIHRSGKTTEVIKMQIVK